MNEPWTVALRDYPHTTPLKDGSVTPDGVSLEFLDIEPIHRAFAPMVRRSAFDVSELAIATLFQALEAERPLVALPVVLHGNLHHRSISVLNGQSKVAAAELPGSRVGVRAYSQTTGMWVRGILSDTFGVRSQDVTWVTREGPHVESAVDPDNVEHTDEALVDLLESGKLAAVVMGARSADHDDRLTPLLPDWKVRQEQYTDTHGWVPINHLVVVRRELAEESPEKVRSLYRGFADAIESARSSVPGGTTRERVVQAGITDQLVATLETALRYAREQEVIRRNITVDEIFAPFRELIGE